MKKLYYIMNAFFVRFWHKWGVKAGLSIADQGVFSTANFIINILLARWLAPSEYGIFAIAFSFFLFVSGFHQALILEPMSVIGSARYSNKVGTYLGVTAWIHGGFSFLFFGILILVSTIMVLKNNILASSFFGLAIAVPLILFFWLFRQACYLEIKPGLALKGSLLYSILLFFGLLVLYRQNRLSSFSALFVMGVASFSASLVFFHYLGVRIVYLTWDVVRLTIRNIFLEHWRYGKWVVGSAFVNWLSLVIYLPFVGFFVGFSEAAAFKATQNIMMPLQRVLTGLSLLLLPWASRQRVIQGKDYLKRRINKFIIMSVLLSFIYVIPAIFFSRSIMKFLYGPGYYDNFLWLIPWLGAVAIMESMSYGLCIGLRALERSDYIFWAQVVTVILTLTVGLYLVITLKIYGAVLGLLFARFLITVLILYFLQKCLRHTC